MEISALKSVLEDRFVRSSPECYGMVVEAFEFLTHRRIEGSSAAAAAAAAARVVNISPNRPVDNKRADVGALCIDAASSPPEFSSSSSALDFSSSSSSSSSYPAAAVAAAATGGGDIVVPMILDSPPLEKEEEDAKKVIIEAIGKIMEENSLINNTVVDGEIVSSENLVIPANNTLSSTPSFSSSSNCPQDDQRKSGEVLRGVRPQPKLQVIESDV